MQSIKNTLRDMGIAATITVSPLLAHAQKDTAPSPSPSPTAVASLEIPLKPLFSTVGNNQILRVAAPLKPAVTTKSPAFHLAAAYYTEVPTPNVPASVPVPAGDASTAGAGLQPAEVVLQPKHASMARKLFSAFARGTTPELDHGN